MNLQVLVSTMNQTDYSLLDKMHINSNAIVINQCNKFRYSSFIFNGNRIQWYSLAERGIGLSRNTALMRAASDIVLFADDDEVFDSDYKEIIIDSFLENPDKDVLIFFVESQNLNRPTRREKDHNLHWFNSLKYGTFRIAAKLQSLRQANVSFSLLFGGGAKYQAGEDSLFIQDCLKKGLKLRLVDKKIGIVNHQTSTWFEGFTSSYFYDKGILLRQCFGRLSFLISLIIILKNPRTTKKTGIMNAYISLIKGMGKRKI